ncbi:PAS domain-containing protein [Oleiagrimonas sp.]|uniref:PAS domain-containing protein n=1 Tax=Oleiagrimonas sp. TaxID=2010330 RepID=UPI0026395A9A|nr:PAS domain-containing protein [Oleiagrimonas sp.]MDA3913832.1 PAS domain-containing protein [Oleiagrimonas sp.]
MLDIVAKQQPLRGRLDAICSLFEQTVSGMVAMVMRLDDSGRLHFVSAPNAPQAILKRLDQVKPGPESGSCAHAAWSGEPTYVSDAGSDKRWSSLQSIARMHRIHSCWSYPVRDREQEVIGTFSLTSFESRLPDAFQRLLLDLGASVVGLLFDQDREALESARRDETLRRMALVADATANGVLFIDSSGHIEWMNAGMQALFGRTGRSIIGTPVGEFLSGPRTDMDRLRTLQAAILHGERFSDTLVLTDKNGHTLISQVTCTPHQGENGDYKGVVAMFVDVTGHKRLSEFNVLLAKVSEAIAHENDPTAVLQTICDLAVQHAGLRLAWIGIPDPKTGWFHAVAKAGIGMPYLDEVHISADPLRAEGQGPGGRTWRDGASYYNRSFEHAPSLAPWAHIARKFKFAGSATLPIQRGGQMWAVLMVYHEQLDSFDDALRNVLETLAANISRGLDRIDLTQREHDVQALNQSMLDSATLGVTLIRNRIILRANQRAAEILGATSTHDLVGKDVTTLYPSREISNSVAERIREAFRQNNRAILETPVRRLDGRIIWMRLDGAPFEHEGFDEIWTLVDVTEQHEAVESQALLANALIAVGEGVLITNADQKTIYVNPAFEALTGYDFETMRGQNCNVLQGRETDPQTKTLIRECIQNGKPFEGEILNYTRQGKAFWNLLTINPLRDEAGNITHFVGVQRDITEMRNLNQRLAYQAFHDELTGLPNRRDLDRHLTDVLKISTEQGKGVALAIIDLDDFKTINDSLGHKYGDELLKSVTGRLKTRMHPGDFIARLGGDEFVIVFSNLPDSGREHEIRRRVLDLGESFDAPYEIKHGHAVEIGLSMGVALSPEHASEGGTLLRLADEALFQAKQNKFERTHWWAIYGSDEAEYAAVEQPMDTYGEAAADILEKSVAPLGQVLGPFVEAFYKEMAADAYAKLILINLGEHDFAHLKHQQVRHLTFLTDPKTTHEVLIKASMNIGRIHALSGVDSTLLMRWMTFYQDLVSKHFNALPMGARQRYRLVQLVEHRLQDDMHAQLQAQEQLHLQYMHTFEQPMPQAGNSWNEAMLAESERISSLPGVSCVLVMRQNTQDRYSIESATGPTAQRVTKAFEDHFGGSNPASILPPEDTRLSRAWQTASIQHLTSFSVFSGDNAKARVASEMLSIGIRSATYIPVLDENKQPVALILVMGHFPNQFNGKEMQYFTRSLQQRWSEIWFRITRPSPPIAQELGIEYRRQLFKGGLRMLLQPVVELGSGKLVKAEALARLQLEDGTLLSPDVFLPLLRHAELDSLFQKGLDTALGSLVQLQHAGLDIDLSMNIAPRTLANPACEAWVKESLQRHQIKATNLTLEILENQRVDPMARDDGVRRLMVLGVKFAIDDLGSGYSSLRRLASMHFNAIKVDQTLLSRIRMDPIQTVSLVSAVIQIGRDFGSEVIVEGLEHIGMIEVARLLGAQFGQGYAIARPMPADALPHWSRTYLMTGLHESLNTMLGALAFQWLSVRHESLHTHALDTCPLTRLIQEGAQELEYALALHRTIHSNPHDLVAARKLLEWLEGEVRRDALSPAT